ncbi:MAG: diguanylate cyclase [Gammaproteobacteria bacterium]|nr:diguanylate cyclase [Gammaproteobacteria bacterium]MBU1646556.1 diguanylate cyclase [Gammaproteobacteria bacterium]MBU1972813.1 diguanylate cyclase [Gammaproteobacteria bacterium]
MKILLVEDVRSIASVMAARLGSYGHDVTIAENGAFAIELFKKVNPDLILMDIEMPVMNGFETATHIRSLEAKQQWAWTPIMFLTASDSPENLVTAIESGGDGYLVKTVPEPVLHAKMKAMARIAALRQRLAFANGRLQQQASHDGLTGLYNRPYMDMTVDAVWDEAVRLRQAFAVLMLDVDNFKRYNDQYGHQAGDDCLRKVATILGNTMAACNAEGLTQSAFAARYGGEEFAIVIPRSSSAAYEGVAAIILDDLRRSALPHEGNAEWGIVTLSVGGARLDAASGTVADVFRVADKNLYRAKETGRNRAELS